MTTLEIQKVAHLASVVVCKGCIFYHIYFFSETTMHFTYIIPIVLNQMHISTTISSSVKTKTFYLCHDQMWSNPNVSTNGQISWKIINEKQIQHTAINHTKTIWCQFTFLFFLINLCLFGCCHSDFYVEYYSYQAYKDRSQNNWNSIKLEYVKETLAIMWLKWFNAVKERKKSSVPLLWWGYLSNKKLENL